MREQQLFNELRNKVFSKRKNRTNESVKTRYFATVEVLVPNRAPPNIYARYKRKREGRISIIERGREEAKVERGDGSKAILQESMRPSPFLLSLLHFPSSFPQRVTKVIKSIKICRERLLKFFKFSEEIRLGKMADNRALRNGNGMEGRE